MGVPVSILGIYGSLQFFLRELFVGISLGGRTLLHISK
ncbi:hypothetical protein LEP1GSC052_2701 [Leptospira kmetyi serovar Malaysia str. Bejo-Iso9]|nr:hypothetical protein LEP1GSC052_2701 [Leptospira kmetyi serovar Malaysia str. Bejo-Iso9]